MHLRKVHDFDLEDLTHILGALDQILNELFEQCDDSGDLDPESAGVYDRMEYLAGIGFAACQRYLTAVMGEKGRGRKKELLARGSLYRDSRRSIPAVVNAAANYWKHSEEWGTDDEENGGGGAHRDTIAVLESIGAWSRTASWTYTLRDLLFEAVQEMSLLKLVPHLVAWRDDLIATGDCTQ